MKKTRCSKERIPYALRRALQDEDGEARSAAQASLKRLGIGEAPVEEGGGV